MLDEILFVVFIVGALYLIYYGTSFLLSAAFGRPSRDWVSQLYQNHSGVDLGKVKKFVADGIMPKVEFSHWEMVAIFGSFLLKEDVTDVVKRAQEYAHQGWEKNFNYDFFNELAQAAQRISIKEKKRGAKKLIMFGQRLAELYGKSDWSEQYHQILEKEFAEEATREWDESRRWKT